MEQHHLKEPQETETVEEASDAAQKLVGTDTIAIVFSLLVIGGVVVYAVKTGPVMPGYRSTGNAHMANPLSRNPLEEAVIPSGGMYVPLRWGGTGMRMMQTGVIDRQKFDGLYAESGGVDTIVKTLLEQTDNDRITITPENAGQILNLLWALGLANRNPILTEGPMQDPRYGGAAGFASTGGWTLARGSAMSHYAMHDLVPLTPEQQERLERVAKTIYRPCCGNATYFPDCNHGMAMLGLLELMASQDASEESMYRAALAVNSYWFPDMYLTIAEYLREKGIAWENANPKQILGEQFSSAAGYRRVVAEMTRPTETTTPRRPSGGCGV